MIMNFEVSRQPGATRLEDNVKRNPFEFLTDMLEEKINDTISDNIDYYSKKGKDHLNQVLIECNFHKDPINGNYEIWVTAEDNVMTFSVFIDPESFSDSAKEKMASDRSGRVIRNYSENEEARSKAKTWLLKVDKSARSPYLKRAGKVYHSAIVRAPDARKTSRHRPTIKNAKMRREEHATASVYPRGLSIDEKNQVDVSLQVETSRTRTKFVYPNNKYSGAIKKFLDKMTEMVDEKFADSLNRMIKRENE
jgi:hypothetical protein